jgi:hypothetical protein
MLPLVVFLLLHRSDTTCPRGYIFVQGPDNSVVCEDPGDSNWLGAVALTEGRDLNERHR